MMAKLVVAAFGSWGDVFPAFGLATALRDRGHSVRVAAPAYYAEFAEAEGLGFVAAGPPWTPGDANDVKIADGRFGGLIGIRYILRKHVLPFLDADVDLLVGAAADADGVIAHPLMFAATIAADVLKLPCASFSLFPDLVPSAYTQPKRFPVPANGPVGRMFNREGWFTVRRMFDVLAGKGVNRARTRVGLDPVRHPWFWPIDSGKPFLVLASSATVARPADWPSNVELTGAINWDHAATARLPEELDQFLHDGPAPVLVTLGSSSALTPGRFFHDAAAAIERAGHRALFLTGPALPELIPAAAAGRFVAEFAPLSTVATRCVAAIHHGGAGTAAAFLKAGIPHLVVPGMYDQPHTAHRLESLGVAGVVPKRRVTTQRLERSLVQLLSDERYVNAAMKIAKQLAAEDGPTQAAERIEKMLKR